MLKEELQLLQEPGSYVGEVVKVMGKSKVLVKVSKFSIYILVDLVLVLILVNLQLKQCFVEIYSSV